MVAASLLLLNAKTLRNKIGLEDDTNESVQMLLVVSLFGLALIYFQTARNMPQITRPMTEADIKKEMVKFNGSYQIMLKFYIIGSPDELVRTLQNHQVRKIWDQDVYKAESNEANNVLKVSYNAADVAYPGFMEEIKISYMVHNGKFHIIEQIESATLGKYSRVWILE